jgi:hypothetical protein
VLDEDVLPSAPVVPMPVVVPSAAVVVFEVVVPLDDAPPTEAPLVTSVVPVLAALVTGCTPSSEQAFAQATQATTARRWR